MVTEASIFADDLYRRLNVERTAQIDDIKRAYRRLLRQYPPERAPEEFKRIREAYETLTDPHARHEYDTQPDPAVRVLLERALSAMGKEDYPAAERLFKQVLIQQPDLAFARNHLGLCLLYQERAEDAVEQFERLMRTEDHAAYIFGNAAHAYQMAGRLPDAERAFRYAIDLGAEDTVSYFVGLAGVYVEQRKFREAKALLEEAIRADGRVDFEDLQFFTKLLEVHILDRDLEGTRSVLQRVERIVTDDEEARYVAWKLGKFGQDLVLMRAFGYAALFAAAAERLQKHDGDYTALRRATELLDADEIDEAFGYVSHHPSFQPSGWLSELRPIIEEHCARRRVFRRMRPIKKAPRLWGGGGLGTTLHGRRTDYDAGTGSFVATLYLIFLFIPLIPVARYRVVERGRNVSFLGKLPLTSGQKLRIGLVLAAAIYVGVWINVAAGGSGSGTVPAQRPAATSTYRSPPASPTAPGRTGIQAEQERIRGMESRLRRIEDDMDATATQLESLRGRIERIERDAGLGSWYDRAEYERLINRHNQYVEDYNASLASYEVLYSQYSSAVDAYNRRLRGR